MRQPGGPMGCAAGRRRFSCGVPATQATSLLVEHSGEAAASVANVELVRPAEGPISPVGEEG